MLSSKLSAMSIGTMWVARSQEQSQFARPEPICAELTSCPICRQSWILKGAQSAEEQHTVLVVLAEPITDADQQTLFEKCLAAAGWDASSTRFSLHLPCSSTSQDAVLALQEQIENQQPKLIIVFGVDVAHLIYSELVPGRINEYANTPLIVAHHPQAMLENPALKAQVWADFCLVKDE